MSDIFSRLPSIDSLMPAFVNTEGANVELYSNVDMDVFESYSVKLVNEGFAFYDSHLIQNNFHRTFYNNDILVQLYYNGCDGSMRIVADENTTLYKRKADTAFSRKSDSALFQFETDHSWIDCGMCYIVKCADNNFFIIDSAHHYSRDDHNRIHKFLRERTPEGEKTVISGWFLSHAHHDHVEKFMDFLKAGFEDTVIECIYYNFPTPEHRDYPAWTESDRDEVIKFSSFISSISDIPKVTLHTGEHFYIRNLEFEVLLTHEDILPAYNIKNENESSTVLMMTVSGSKTLFLGDCGSAASEVLMNRYGDYLKSDIVQIAHHGHDGAPAELYELVNARAALFPTTQIKYDEDFPVREGNRRAVELCDEYYISSNGTVEIKLPYVKGQTTIHPDETHEDFKKIRSLWGYVYDYVNYDELN